MLRIICCCLFTAAIGAGAAEPGAREGAGLYLFRIPTERGESAATAFGDAMHAVLHVQNARQVAKQLAATTDLGIVQAGDDHIRIAMTGDNVLTGTAEKRYLDATFVLDFDEPAVAAVLQALREDGSGATIGALVDFVYRYIESKSYRRSFDIASQVAGSREGDCTEHAALLAALARGMGRPARIVLGILFLEADSGLSSFGHAWTEIHDGDGWRIADATRPDLLLPDAPVRYLPMFELSDEGPGYAMDLMRYAMMHPARIEQAAERP